MTGTSLAMTCQAGCAACDPLRTKHHAPIRRRPDSRARERLQRRVGPARCRGHGASLADDAQFITVNGARTTSRVGFRDLMARLHGPSGPFRTSTRRTPEMSVTFLAPDIAILHSRFWIDGEVLHDDLSQASRESVGTRVVRKLGGRWRIVATQNTDVRHGRRH